MNPVHINLYHLVINTPSLLQFSLPINKPATVILLRNQVYFGSVSLTLFVDRQKLYWYESSFVHHKIVVKMHVHTAYFKSVAHVQVRKVVKVPH